MGEPGQWELAAAIKRSIGRLTISYTPSRFGVLMEKWLENSGVSMVDCIDFRKRELHGIIQNLARYVGWLAT